MKQRSTTPVSSYSFAAKAAAVACAVLVAISMPIQLGKTVFAVDYNSQIQAAQNEAAQNQAQADQLHQMADSLQTELQRLEEQKSAIQAQVDASQVKINDFTARIKDGEEKINLNKSALGNTIKDIYVDSDTSALEMVAGSNNIADYVDKQAQQDSIQSKLNSTITTINTLVAKQKEEKKGVEREQDKQKIQRDQLAEKESEKAKLITETRGQEDAYKSQADTNNKRVADLRAAQAEEVRRALAAMSVQRSSGSSSGGSGGVVMGDPSGGGYPYTAGVLDYGVDPWGMFYRECTSYGAWKVASTGRYMPNWGHTDLAHARYWPGLAVRDGIPTGGAPRAGAIAIWPIGSYGHVMYVEAVNGDGTITVSDYNLAWDGMYRKYTRSAGGLTYIYF